MVNVKEIEALLKKYYNSDFAPVSIYEGWMGKEEDRYWAFSVQIGKTNKKHPPSPGQRNMLVHTGMCGLALWIRNGHPVTSITYNGHKLNDDKKQELIDKVLQECSDKKE